ncbi:MAG: hypothetical protein HOO06_10920 [Bdellovibrionaceae bacterium]|nr:hypothetical protein [Pseudobdellovibrionaceae bacterium]
MKAILTAALCLALYPATSQASKARMEALGQRNSGSAYIMDARNMFRNPASLMDAKNQVMLEWGTSTARDSAAAPIPEGGFIHNMGSGKSALILGSESDTASDLRNQAAQLLGVTAGDSFLLPSNSFDFFYAGKSGMGNWGASLTYSANQKEDATGVADESTMGLRLGMATTSWDAYLILGLGNTANGLYNATPAVVTPTAKFEGKSGFELGGSYNLANGKVFGKYKGIAVSAETAGAAATVEATISNLELGWANMNEVTGGFWFYSAALQNDVTEIDHSLAARDSTTTAMILPVVVGFEADANSWLALRGSIKQNLLLNSTDTEVPAASATYKNSDLAATTVATGASLKFDALSIDGTLGKQSSGTLDLGSNMFTRVAVNYTF